MNIIPRNICLIKENKGHGINMNLIRIITKPIKHINQLNITLPTYLHPTIPTNNIIILIIKQTII